MKRPLVWLAGLALGCGSTDAATTPAKTSCPLLACAAPALTLPAPTGFDHDATTMAAMGASPKHRARDLVLSPTEPGFAVAQFGYAADGALEDPTIDEAVDVYLLAGCAGPWAKVGSARTSMAALPYPAVAGVGAAKAAISVPLPALPVGVSLVRAVLIGDNSTVDALVDVVEAGAPFFVSDVDGTLTSSEGAEINAELEGTLPTANPNAATALTALATRGYTPIYLTARPFSITQRTRDFLTQQGFPLGIVRTTMEATGLSGDDAATFKTGELAEYATEGVVPAFAFGNMPSDADAYQNAGLDVSGRYFFQSDDGAAHGGSRVDDYQTLVPTFDALALTCR